MDRPRRVPLPLSVPAAVAVAAGTPLAGLVTGDVSSLVFALPYAGAGLLLAVRRPGQPIAWLLLGIGAACVTATARVVATPADLLAGTASPADTAVAWASGWGWDAVFGQLFVLALVFPSGRLPVGRIARRVSQLVVGLGIAVVLAVAFAPTLFIATISGGEPVPMPNPVAFLPGAPFWSLLRDEVLITAELVLLVGGAISLVVRYRRATGLGRLQLRWLMTAVALTVVAAGLALVVTTVIGGAAEGDPRGDIGLFLIWVPTLLAFPTVPGSIVAAVLRYRLYDIDRIVSRTIGYAVATTILLGTFGVAVLGLQALLEPVTKAQTVPVAVSTLLAAMLFQPLRRRVQGAVDRAFFRARADQAAVVRAFTADVRTDADLDTVREALRRAVDTSLQPAVNALWVRSPRRSLP